MYVKLFIGNIKKTFHNYTIYFFTLIVSSTLFFAFLSLTSRYNDILNGDGNYSLTLFQNIIRYTILTISIIFLALIQYIHTYMLKQRSKEFFIYMILGMEQKIIARQFFIETFSFGILAVLLGCITGTILSGIITTFVMRTILGSALFQLGFYPDTIQTTICFFGASFILIGTQNAHKLYKIKLIHLMNKRKEKPIKGNLYYIIHFLITILSFCIVGFSLFQFTGITTNYSGNIPTEISNRYQTITILAAIIGIFSFYHAFAFLIALIRRRKKWKNHNINSVLIGCLFQKISSTAKILSISTIAITISLVAFAILPIAAEITTGYLEYRMPYTLMINNNYQYIDKIEDIPQIDYIFVENILKNHGITIMEQVAQKSYFVWKRDFNTVATRRNWRDLPRLAISISDYNTMRKMAGFDPVWLNEDEFFMHLDYEIDMKSVANSIHSKGIQLDNGTFLNIAEKPVYNEQLGKYLFNNNSSVLVFPDSVCDNLYIARICYYANTKDPIPYQLCNIIRDEINLVFKNSYPYLYKQYEAKYKTNKNYIDFIEPIRFWTQENNDVKVTATSIRLLGIYSGIIFFIICMTVLALHLITDSIDQQKQYQTLYQIGVDQADITKMVNRQSTYYFFIPCIIALILALLLIYSFVIRYGHKIFTYISKIGFQFGIFIPTIIVFLLFICYYGIAIYTVHKNVNNTLNTKN